MSFLRDLEEAEISKDLSLAKTNLSNSIEEDSETASKNYELAKKTNIPLDIVKDQPKEIEKNLSFGEVAFEELRRDYPATFSVLKDDQKSQMIDPDDIQGLKDIEYNVSALATTNPFKDFQFAKDISQGVAKGFERTYADFHHLAPLTRDLKDDDLRKVANIISNHYKLQQELNDEPDYVKEGREALGESGEDLGSSWDKLKNVRNYVNDQFDGLLRGDFDKILKKHRKFMKTPGNTFSDSVEAMSALSTHLGAYARNPKAFVYMTAEQFANTGVSSVIGGAASLISKFGGPVGRIAGYGLGKFASALPIEAAAWVSEALRTRGYDLTNPESIMEAYKNPEVMDAIRGEALRKGLGTAGIDTMAEVLGLGVFKKGSKIRDKIKQTIKSGLVNTGGEFASEFGGRKFAKGELDGGDFVESVDEAALGTGSTSLGVITSIGKNNSDNISGLPISDEVRKKIEKALKDGDLTDQQLEDFTNEIEKGLDSVRDKGEIKRESYAEDNRQGFNDYMGDLGSALENVGFGDTLDRTEKALKASKAAVRNGDIPKQVIDQTIENRNLGTENTFFQTDEWDDFFTSKGMSPRQKAAELMGDNGKAYDEAKRLGQDLEIGVADYLLKKLTDADLEGLNGLAKPSPNGMSREKAMQMLNSTDRMMDEFLGPEIEEQAKPFKKKREKSELQKIKQDLEKQVIDAGRNKVEALPIYHFFKVMGERTGLGATELFKRYNLKIKKTNRNKFLKSLGLPVSNQRAAFTAKDNNLTIDIFENANKATFLHESGHLFYRVMSDLYNDPKTKESIKGEFESLLSWLEAENSVLTTEQQEKFADGFLRFITEGNAPQGSKRVRQAFKSYQLWLTSLYRDADKDFGVELSDEVRDTLNRMFASEVEINRAEQQLGLEELLADPSKTIGKDTREKYLELKDAAKEESKRRIYTKLLNDERSKFNKQRAEVRAKVKKELEESSDFLAFKYMKDNNIKVLQSELVSKFGEKAKDFPKTLVVKNESENTRPVREVAGDLGFDTVDDFLFSLSQFGTLSQDKIIDILTEKEMQFKHPDLLISPEISEQAVDSFYNENTERFLRFELDYILEVDKAGAKKITAQLIKNTNATQQLRQDVNKIIESQSVERLRKSINNFKTQERRARTEVSESFKKGDFEKAYREKTIELFNFLAYKKSKEGLKEIDNVKNTLKKVRKSDAKLKKTHDMDLINAARLVLSDYGVAEFSSLPSRLRQIRKYDPETNDVINTLLETLPVEIKPFEQLNLTQAQSVLDTVEALVHFAQDVKSTNTAQGKILIKDLANNLKDTLDNKKLKLRWKSKEGQVVADGATKAKLSLTSFLAAQYRMENLFRFIGGNDPNNSWIKDVWDPISEGSDKYVSFMNEQTKIFKELADANADSLTEDEIIKAPELGKDVFFARKNEIIMALLHTGNSSNYRKLLLGQSTREGHTWGFENEDGTINDTPWKNFINRLVAEGKLTKKDYDFVSGVWKVFDDLKPELQRTHKDIYGDYFKEIEIGEIETPFGIIKGGYVPAKTDPDLVVAAQVRNQDVTDKVGQQKSEDFYSLPSVGLGATKERVEYNKPLMLKGNMLINHLQWAGKFIHLQKAGRDVSRVLLDHDLQDSIENFSPGLYKDAILPWLERSVNQSSTEMSKYRGVQAFDRFMGEARRRVSANIMFGHIRNAVEQFTALSQAVIEVSPKELLIGLSAYRKDRVGNVEQILKDSEYMRNRLEVQFSDMRDQINSVVLDKQQTGLKKWLNENALFLQTWTQKHLDYAMYNAAYSRAAKKGLTHEQSVKEAESAVRRVMGSYRPSDIARVQKSTETLKALNMFYGYFNNLANLQGFAMLDALENLTGPELTKKLTYIHIFGHFVPAFLSGVLRWGFGGFEDEDKDGDYWDDAISSGTWEYLSSFSALIPYGGSVFNSFIRRSKGVITGKKEFGENISVSPLIGFANDGLKATTSDLSNLLGKGKLTGSSFRRMLTLTGMLTNIPLRPLSKPISPLIDDRVDFDEPLDATRTLLTGRPKR